LDLSQIFNLAVSAITIIGAVFVWRKSHSEVNNLDSQTMQNYQTMLRQASDDIKQLRLELNQQGLEMTIIKAELSKQTEIATTYKNIADNAAKEKATMNEELSTMKRENQKIRADLARFEKWAKRLVAQLREAAIEPAEIE
jgi:uncharacterized protein (DUF305 family)